MTQNIDKSPSLETFKNQYMIDYDLISQKVQKPCDIKHHMNLTRSATTMQILSK